MPRGGYEFAPAAAVATEDASRARFIAFARAGSAAENGAPFLFESRLDEAARLALKPLAAERIKWGHSIKTSAR